MTSLASNRVILLYAVVREPKGTFGMTACANGLYDAGVLVFILLGWIPWPLVLALAVVLYLTVVELLEWRPHYVWWFWWLLLVFMTNFVGYLFLRAYGVYRRHQLKRA